MPNQLRPLTTAPNQNHHHPKNKAHFSRVPLSGDMAADQRTVVAEAVRLLQVGGWGPSGLFSGMALCLLWPGEGVLDTWGAGGPALAAWGWVA